MTSELLDVAGTYKQIADAEKQALALEKMLDDLDTKMDSILDQIKQNDEERREQLLDPSSGNIQDNTNEP